MTARGDLTPEKSARVSLIERLWLLVTVGVAAATVAFVDGIVQMAHRRLTPCANGTYFPPGSKNFNCYSHPHVGTGLAISAFALAIGILLGLVGWAILTLLRSSLLRST